MNNSAIRSLILLAILGAGAESVYAKQPPDVVNSDAAQNTAMGSAALVSLSSGSNNTASGFQALVDTDTGDDNTGAGAFALWCNGVGSDNTAVGYYALALGTGGYQNTAVGSMSLSDNTGSSNTAIGFQSAYHTTGDSNTALGRQALLNNTSGGQNIAVGDHGGQNLTTGSNNIDIGNLGVGGESGIIRIGTSGTQTDTYIAGIAGHQVTGAAVYVTSAGQLGVLASSERYKTSIAPMGTNTEKLQQLRPVTFHLKSDPNGALQFGLIAEEVDKIYPELVIRDDTGKIQGVRYDELAPMLLNEMQLQHRINAAQADKSAEQAATIAAQASEIRDLKQLMGEMQAGLFKLQAKDELVAQR